MAASKCACGHGQFEMKANSPQDSTFKVMFIQCGSCGLVVGTTDYVAVGATVAEIHSSLGGAHEKLDKLGSRISVIEHELTRIRSSGRLA